MPRKGGYYAVNSGRRTGVVDTWAECESLVKGYSGAKFQKFNTLQEAQDFARGDSYGGTSSSSATRGPSYSSSSSNQRSSPPCYSIPSVFVEPRQSRQEKAVVYTDGACSGNGRAGARAGIGVYWGPGDSRNVSEPLEGKPTNNRAEIHAAARAIRQARDQGYEKVEIRTDSNFLVDSATKWVDGWQQKNWKTAAGKPVINKDDFTDLLEASKGIDVEYTHVPGHAGIHGNERADDLAVSGMMQAKRGTD